MSRMSEFALTNRDMSSFMVSVGLGLMLETFFDPITTRIDDERKVKKVNINKYKIHYYNIYTMLRNILQAVPKADIKTMILKDRDSYKYMVNVLYSELEIMNEMYHGTDCIPVLYVPDYSDVIKELPNSIDPFNLTGVKQLTHELFEKSVKQYMKESYRPMSTIKIKTSLPSSSDDILITTHYTYDLLNVERIRRLVLVESHTGVLKDKSMFNTKYHDVGSKFDKKMFPFQRQLLLVLGDSTLIKPVKIGYRYLLCEEAINNKWTPFTSEERVKKVLDKLKKDL